MHEIHTARKIIRMALSRAGGSDYRSLKAVCVRVGAWTGIDIEHLKHDFEAVAPGVDLRVEVVEPSAHCSDCGASFRPDQAALECAACGSRRVTMDQTTDIELINVVPS
ncbi:MAG: hydrogenase/urease maturation nickel metallochaperone HypA [Armatimonadota bacterium]